MRKGKLKGKSPDQLQSYSKYVRAWVTFHPDATFMISRTQENDTDIETPGRHGMRLATGGATGIGAATVARLRADGHEVVIFDIQKPDGDAPWIELDLMDEGRLPPRLKRRMAALTDLSPSQVSRLARQCGALSTVNTLATCAFIDGFCQS